MSAPLAPIKSRWCSTHPTSGRCRGAAWPHTSGCHASRSVCACRARVWMGGHTRTVCGPDGEGVSLDERTGQGGGVVHTKGCVGGEACDCRCARRPTKRQGVLPGHSRACRTTVPGWPGEALNTVFSLHLPRGSARGDAFVCTRLAPPLFPSPSGTALLPLSVSGFPLGKRRQDNPLLPCLCVFPSLAAPGA